MNGDPPYETSESCVGMQQWNRNIAAEKCVLILSRPTWWIVRFVLIMPASAMHRMRRVPTTWRSVTGLAFVLDQFRALDAPDNDGVH